MFICLMIIFLEDREPHLRGRCVRMRRGWYHIAGQAAVAMPFKWKEIAIADGRFQHKFQSVANKVM